MSDHPSCPTSRHRSALDGFVIGRDTDVDIGRALTLLAEVVRERGRDWIHPRVHRQGTYLLLPHARHGSPDCIVGAALARAGVDGRGLETLCDDGILEAYASDTPRITITLGAAIVLHAAQRAQDRGRSWGEALDSAEAAVATFLELVPQCIFRAIAIERANR